MANSVTTNSIEADVPIIKSTPESMYEKLKNKTFLAPKALPHRILSIEVLKGDGKNVGSIMGWKYVLLLEAEGIKQSKERINIVVDEQKFIQSSFFEGDIGSKYHSFGVEWHVFGKKDLMGSKRKVNCRIRYIKKEHVPEADPYQYLELFCEMIAALDLLPYEEEK